MIIPKITNLPHQFAILADNEHIASVIGVNR